MNAVTLGDLNASSKTMNQNLKNGHAIAFGAHHCGRVGKLLGVFFDRPRRARECHLQAKDGSPTIVAAGLAMLIRGGDGARLTMGGVFLPKRRNDRVARWASMAQPSIQRWRQRRRRQRIFGVVVVIVLVAALLYGWLRVFGKL
jgi:hypothetical protein